MWLWVYYNKIPIDPVFCLLKGDYKLVHGDSSHDTQGAPQKAKLYTKAELPKLTEQTSTLTLTLKPLNPKPLSL